MVPSLLQNTGRKNKERWSEKKQKQKMVALRFSHHTAVLLTTAAQRPCLYAAAELAALVQSAPLLFSAARLQGR